MREVLALKKREEILAKRMVGEVYPELLSLMIENGTERVHIKAVNTDGGFIDNKFTIRIDGVIIDNKPTYDDNLDLIRAEIFDIFTEVVEAEDEGDEPTESRQWDLKREELCPVFITFKSLNYLRYCEGILEIIDEFHKTNESINGIMEKINKIPFRKKVIIEKISSK